MNLSIEKLLIQIYKHINESRDLTEQLINHIGKEQHSIKKLPPDVENLLQIALELSPDQRKKLELFINSLKE